jgi:hypothetical protein
VEDGDIYRWHYKRGSAFAKSFEPYHCKSCIGIWSDRAGGLVDTYWHGGSGSVFTKENIAKNLETEFIANINDLTPVKRYEFNNYDDEDCIDISHANMTSSGFYIKNGAVHSIEKKRRVLEAHISHEMREIDFHQWQLSKFKDALENLTVETHVPYDNDVCIPKPNKDE